MLKFKFSGVPVPSQTIQYGSKVLVLGCSTVSAFCEFV